MQDKSLVPGAAIRGWFDNVPPNGFTARPGRQAYNDNADGLAAARPDVEIETTPEHRNLVAGDPECVGWRRRFDDSGVAGRRSHLGANSGIADLEMVEPHQSERAAGLFHRDGFVVVAGASTGDRFDELKRATDRVVDQLLEADPDGSVGGGAGGLPSLDQEPDEMKLSTLVGVPAGSAVFRDNRAWHGGTPNLWTEVRAFPNIEYFAPWFRSEGIHRCMPSELWQRLSDHGKRICRYVTCAPDELVVGSGFNHPRRAVRERFVADQLAALAEACSHQANDWWQRR